MGRLWFNSQGFRNPPQLNSTAYVSSDDPKEDSPQEIQLKDHPLIQSEYDEYLRTYWIPWAKEHMRRDSIQAVYSDLFRIHQQLQKMGEVYEIFVGFGCLTWTPEINSKKSHPMRRHVIEAKAELEFDPRAKEIRLVCHQEGAQCSISDDMLEADLRPDIIHYEVIKKQLEQLGDQVWDKRRISAALSEWSRVLSPDGQFSDLLDPPKVRSGLPVINYAPAFDP